jgi:hypothetical protein
MHGLAVPDAAAPPAPAGEGLGNDGRPNKNNALEIGGTSEYL